MQLALKRRLQVAGCHLRPEEQKCRNFSIISIVCLARSMLQNHLPVAMTFKFPDLGSVTRMFHKHQCLCAMSHHIGSILIDFTIEPIACKSCILSEMPVSDSCTERTWGLNLCLSWKRTT